MPDSKCYCKTRALGLGTIKAPKSQPIWEQEAKQTEPIDSLATRMQLESETSGIGHCWQSKAYCPAITTQAGGSDGAAGRGDREHTGK